MMLAIVRAVLPGSIGTHVGRPGRDDFDNFDINTSSRLVTDFGVDAIEKAPS